jgi:hypothetical protein
MPLPDKIKNKPEVKLGLELYWKAFQDLSSDRDIGMGVGPIPWSSMNEWGARNHIRGDDFERFVAVLRGMDSIYMDKQSKKAKGKMGKSKGLSKAKAMRNK